MSELKPNPRLWDETGHRQPGVPKNAYDAPRLRDLRTEIGEYLASKGHEVAQGVLIDLSHLVYDMNEEHYIQGKNATQTNTADITRWWAVSGER